MLDGLKSQADDRLGEADPKVKLGDLSLFTVPSKKERRLPQGDERRATPQTAFRPASAAEKKAAPQAVSSARKRSGSSAPSGGKASRAQRNRERALKDPEKEIKRRKKNRRFRRFAMRACAVAAAAMHRGGVVFAADLYEKHQSNLSLLSQAFDELEKADILVLNMDDMVMEETVESSSSEDIDALDQGMDDAHVH
ncbi:MAG: hypothetical protein ACLT98_09595 [Eggerthellaceae bacterium]